MKEADTTPGGSLTVSGVTRLRRLSEGLREVLEGSDVVDIKVEMEEQEPVGLRFLREVHPLGNVGRWVSSDDLGGRIGVNLLGRCPPCSALLERRHHRPITITGPDLQALSCELRSAAAHPKDFQSLVMLQSPNSLGLNQAAPSLEVGRRGTPSPV